MQKKNATLKMLINNTLQYNNGTISTFGFAAEQNSRDFGFRPKKFFFFNFRVTYQIKGI